jgi:hypothetical protein
LTLSGDSPPRSTATIVTLFKGLTGGNLSIGMSKAIFSSFAPPRPGLLDAAFGIGN